MLIRKKKRLYCCFVDFKKVFDIVERLKLWGKLFNVGIRGKLLNFICSMYNNMKLCVNLVGKLFEFFKNNIGFLQGEVLFLILFLLYVNDFEMEFLCKGNILI